MTHISSHLNPPRSFTGTGAHRFTAMHQRQRRLHLQELCARVLLVAAFLAAGAISGYLVGIATTTCEALPRIIAEAQSRAAG